MTLPGLGVIALGYLLGTVPTGYLLVKFAFAKGTDIREVGSGSTGATNVSRAAGFQVGLLTYFLDLAKGYLAMTVAALLTAGDLRWMGAAGVAAVLGHLFPVWLGFRGGKGVAVGLGVFLAISPAAMLSALLLWVIIVRMWKYVSLASVIATATVPGWIWFWDHLVFVRPLNEVMTLELSAGVSSALVISMHHDNIRRLWAGTEDRVGSAEGLVRNK
ncbi:MAG: glycerol-3-phosphate 1-O-acyltransferase PlsY [Acidobacteria bacterium]|nr:glycerol-3-phosphate 1-O-acyltransferase PlsY [Acidobacteriota bacterium]